VTVPPAGQPPVDGVETSRPRRLGSRPLAFLAAVAGAGVVLLSSGRDWVTVAVATARGGSVAADGSTAAPGAAAIALVAAAGAVALVTSGRVARVVVAGLLLVAGAAVAALSVPVWQAPRSAADAAVVKVTGTVGGQDASTARVTPWPAVSAAGGLLVAAGGLVGLVRGRRWSGPARRFEPAPIAGAVPATAEAARSERDRRSDDWDSLSRGDDPTADDPA